MKKLFFVLCKITLAVALMLVTIIAGVILIKEQLIIVQINSISQTAYFALTIIAASLLSTLGGALCAMALTLIAYHACFHLASALMTRHEALSNCFIKACWWLEEAFESKNEDPLKKKKLMFCLNSITFLGGCFLLNVASLMAPSLFRVTSWPLGFVCGVWLMTFGTIINIYWKQAQAYFRKPGAEA